MKGGTLLQFQIISTGGQQRARSGWEGPGSCHHTTALPPRTPSLKILTTKTVTSAWFSEDGAISQKEIALQVKPKCSPGPSHGLFKIAQFLHV